MRSVVYNHGCQQDTHACDIALFLFNLGKSATEAKKTIDEAYKKDSVDTNMIREFTKFKKRNFDLKEKPRSGIEEAKPKSVVVHLIEYEERALLRLAEA